MKNISRWIACMLATMFLAGVFAPLATAGSDQDAKDKKDMRRLQLQLAAAQQEKVVLSAQVDELKKQLSEFKSKSTVLEKKTGAERKQISELAEKFQEAEKKIQDLTLLNTETSKTLLQTQTEKDREKNVLEGGVQVCEKKNAALYQISVDLMAKYRSKRTSLGWSSFLN